ncbi:S9 family peptidase [soil metagenome]
MIATNSASRRIQPGFASTAVEPPEQWRKKCLNRNAHLFNTMKTKINQLVIGAVVVVSLFACGRVSLAAAPAAVPFDIEQWMQKKEPAYMARIAVSADGKWLAVAMTGLVTEGSANAAALPQEGGMFEVASEDLAGSEVWIIERQTGKVTRPFQKFAGSFSPVWAPVGAKLSLAVQDSPTRYARIAIWSPGDAEPRIFADAKFHPAIGFSSPTWTPDGRRIVFALRQMPAIKIPRLVQTTLSESREIKSPEAPSSPDTLAVLDVEKGEAKSFTNLGPFEYARVWGCRLSPDGKYAAFLATAVPLKQGIEVNWVRLTVVDLETGAVQAIGRQQMEGWGMSFSWSPDGHRIAWQASPGEIAPTDADKLLIATVGDGAAMREIALPDEMKGGHLHNSEDSPLAPPVWTSDSAGFWMIGKNAIVHFDVDGSKIGGVDLPEGLGGADWLENNVCSFAPAQSQTVPASGELFILRKKEIEIVNLTATPTPAIKSIQATAGDERAIDGATATLFTLKPAENRGWELMQSSLAAGKSSRLALVYPGLPKFKYGPMRVLSWKLASGVACKGTLLLPIGWKDGDKPPVVMDVYGGFKSPGSNSAAAMNEACEIINPHVLGLHGYAFFKPDMPQTPEEPAASLARSADAAVDALHASGFVDDSRVAVVGQSYGGYTALCAITASKRFKAGIVANGIYDLARAETDGPMFAAFVEGGQGLMNASLWEKTQRYIDNSPLYALDKLQSPLLVLQGSGDEISRNQSGPLINSLQRLGKPAELLVGTDMDHVPTSWNIETQRELIPKVLEFLDKNLKANP